MTNNRIGIDLFAGAGGLSLGAELSGINITHAIELDINSAKTFKRNHNKTNVIIDDIRNINPIEIVGSSPFIIMGGPPCQGFSVSNRQTRNLKNQNNNLFIEFLKFVEILSPEWFLFENVEGIVSFNDGKTLNNILQCFNKIGYNTNYKILYASDYGVPQHRNRFFIVGNKRNIDFEFPKPKNKIVTVGEAIGDLPFLNNGDSFDSLPYLLSQKEVSRYAASMRKGSYFATQNIVSRNQDYVIERYGYIKQGQNWRAIPIHLMLNYKNIDNCHSGIYKRLEWNEPSVVISNYRKNMLIHPTQNRGLSVREAARLQSFPDTFIFEGTIHYIQQQIGNAVPPLLAKAIIKQILSYGV